MQQSDHVRKIDQQKARLESVLKDLHRRFREGWYGEYKIKFQGGDPCLVTREEKVKPEHL